MSKEADLRKHPHLASILDHAKNYFKCGCELLLVYQRETETKEGQSGKVKTPLPGFGPRHTINNYQTFVERLWRIVTADGGVPPDNVGVAIATTGALTVLDDDHEGTILKRLFTDGVLDAHNVPPTVMTRRGAHMYYRGGVGGRGGKFKKYPGLDIKGEGGYVIAPPTIIAGRTYTWRVALTMLEELPPLAVEIIEALGRTKEEDQRALDHYSDQVANIYAASRAIIEFLADHDQNISPGQRDNACFQLAARIGDLGIPQGACLKLMERDFFDYIQQYDDDQYNRDDMARVVDNAYKYRQAPVGRDAIEKTFSPIDEADGDGDGDDLGARDIMDAIREPPPQWLVHGLITRGSPVAIIAASGQHKTNVALSLCFCLAVGRDFGPYKIDRPYRVLYIDLEGGAGTRERMKRLVEYYQLTPQTGYFRYTDRQLYLTNNFDVLKIGKYIKRNAIDLVVVDTWARSVAEAEENDAKDMGQVVKRLDQLREHTGTTVMIIAHTPKSGQHTVRGSGAIDASMHTRISVEIASRPGVSPVEVQMLATHVKDSFSGRAMGLVNRAPEGIAMIPKDAFAIVAAADDGVLDVAYKMIRAAGGKPVRAFEIYSEIKAAGGSGRTKVYDVLAAIEDTQFRNGTFVSIRDGRENLIGWVLDGDIEDLIG